MSVEWFYVVSTQRFTWLEDSCQIQIIYIKVFYYKIAEQK